MKILLIEDELALSEALAALLRAEGFAVDPVATLDSAKTAIRIGSYDAVLLDLYLPDGDGMDWLAQLRATSNNPPVIIMTARDQISDRIAGLKCGADDYVVKPFGMRELIARIRAVARRTAQSDLEVAPPAERVFGALKIDVRRQRITLSGEEIHLTAKEFELVEYLSSDPGAVFKRSDILHDVWDTNWYGTSKTLDAHIAAIRKKLGNPHWIESVRGVGFRFEQPS